MLQEGEPEEIDFKKVPALVTWSVASDQAQWLPRLDAIALDCLDADEWAARRWLRLAPRYLGRLAQACASFPPPRIRCPLFRASAARA